MANPTIDIFLELDNDKIFEGEKLLINVNTSVKGKVINGITVAFTCAPTATMNPTSGVTDTFGNVKTIFQPPSITARATYTITITASKTGFTTSTKTFDIIVDILPDDLKTGNLEHSIMLYRIRDMVLNALKKTLENDRELYPSTGLTSTPVYYNGWNYSSKEFPQIIISGSSMTPRETSIGNHMIGEGRELGFPDYEMLGGWFDLSLTLSCVAESKSIQEKLLSNATYALWVQQRSNLWRNNVLLISIDAGNENVEPYGDIKYKYLYGGSVNLKLATEWFFKNIYNHTIDDVVATQTIH